jgi:hypothetical protein
VDALFALIRVALVIVNSFWKWKHEIPFLQSSPLCRNCFIFFRFAGAASRTSGSISASSSFSLHRQNKDAMGIETDGTYLWIVNNTSSSDKVFKYTISGSHLGSWTLQGGVTNPTAITLDPTKVWVPAFFTSA